MDSQTPKELMHEAMSMGAPPRIPVMCQFAIGHTLLQTGVHPLEFFISNDAYADALLKIREMYNFDGVLMHKPGREEEILKITERVEREPEVTPEGLPAEHPFLVLHDGAWIECRRDDDPYYQYPEGFERPAVTDIDPDDPLAWAPESFVWWCRHKGTANWRNPGDFPEAWYGCIDRVLGAVGETHSVHGEVRSPFDHFLNIVGIEAGLMALLDCPDRVHKLMETFTQWSVAWAVAQIRRGCHAMKISSPYANSTFLSQESYAEWIVPSEGPIAKAVRDEGGFVYTHTCGAITDRLELMAEAGINGIETLDPPPLGTIDIADAKERLKGKMFIKGNIDPVNVLLRMNKEDARNDVKRVFDIGRKGGEFILSTACSVAPPTPRENVELLAECVHSHPAHD